MKTSLPARRALLPALLMLACAVVAQQDEGRKYFSISTDRPIRPGETARVQVQSQGVRQLQFRLYRVNDPVKFFRQLDNPHNLGAAPPPRPLRSVTPLERFHRWKLALRARLRDVARAQFNSAQRAAIRQALATPRRKSAAPSKPAPGDDYAAVPLLNPQQVVRVWRQPLSTSSRWESATVPVQLQEKGLYLLEATDASLVAYTAISVTEMSLVAKAAPGRLLVRAVDTKTGEPLRDAALLLINTGTRQIAGRATSDTGGLAEFRPSLGESEGLILTARRGDDFAVATVPGWPFTDRAAPLTGYLYTDRPVYRPSHTVRFKAVLREAAIEGYRLPDARTTRVEIQGPDGKVLHRKEYPINSNGTLWGEFEIPAGAPLGYYSLQANVGEAATFGGFHVEEYRKPEYEVRVTPAALRTEQGSRMTVSVEGRYYYGEPVTQAKVVCSIRTARSWIDGAEGEDESGFGDPGEFGPPGDEIGQREGAFDAQGRFQFDLPLQRAAYDVRYIVEARVTDSAGREISGRGSFLATQGPFYITAEPERWVYPAGATVRLFVDARDYDGNPAPDVPFRATIDSARSAQTGFQPITLEGRTGSNGRAEVAFLAPAPGSYGIRIVAQARSGAEVNGNAWLWVSGQAADWGTRRQRITLVPDRKSYRNGDTARVLVVTGVPEAHLWFSVEGRGVHWSKLVEVRGGSGAIEFPITSAYAPNVFAEAVFVQAGQLWRGTRIIKVPPVEKTLNVRLSSSKPEFKPGEPAAYTIEATDYEGRPASAEFSLGVVDEAIYAIKSEPQPDITQVFYGRSWNRVSTDTSLSYWFYGQAGKRRVQLTSVRPRDIRAQLKPERPAQPRIRKAFPDTAYWIADLKTGADGRGRVQFEFPDSLTAWRATARGVDSATRVGSAIQKTIVRKNVLVTVGAPRFFGEGDEITLPVVVRNLFPEERGVDLSVTFDGAEVIESDGGRVTVPGKGEVRRDWRVRARLGSARVTLLAKALSGAESDALELALPVEPFGLKKSDRFSYVLKDGVAAASASHQFPPGAIPHTRSLVVQLAPSIAGAILGALEYLTSYPYGCTEQTMSSFLPNVIVSRALAQLGAGGVNEAELTKKVRAGLERLFEFQNSEGGWGFWQGDETNPFLTPYVAWGLKQASDAGYRVEPYRLRTAAEALVKAGAQKSADLEAWRLYVLTSLKQPRKDAIDALWNRRSDLSPQGLALLGMAFRETKDPRAADAASQLSSAARSDAPGTAYWSSTSDLMFHEFESDGSVEATAFALRFLLLQDPQNPLLDSAAQWLVAHRDQGHYWSSTMRTAFVLYALIDYLKLGRELEPAFSAAVTVNGRSVLSRSFGRGDITAPPVTITIPASDLTRENRVEIRRSGPGRLYASVRWDYRVDPTGIEPQSSGGLSITRDYFRLAPVIESGKITYDLQPLTGTARAGDTIAVRLVVRGEDRHRSLIIEDPIPAGAEAIPRDDVYNIRGRPDWWHAWYERRELRDNRVSYFPSFIPRGRQQFVYVMKIVNPGVFRIAPARAELMYSPGVEAHTGSRTLEVMRQP
jgi:hypothetical protein